jgi:ubiquinone/menaquinone biosynthesis C-methylase UbiE
MDVIMNPKRWFYRFIDANDAICRRIGRRLPQARTVLDAVYPQTVATAMNAKPGQTMLDIGAGRSCPYAQYRKPEFGTVIIGTDISEEELAYNRDIDQAVVTGTDSRTKLPENSVDIATARSVVEHVENVDLLLAECARVVKPGGSVILSFPSKNAPFSWINRALPHRLSQQILYTISPESKGVLGFKTYYHRCTADQMEQALKTAGFSIESTTVSYFQSNYFSFFLPFYLASAAFELVVWKLNLRNHAATVMIVARKPKPTPA